MNITKSHNNKCNCMLTRSQKVDGSLCGYCILCVPFVSFVPTGRTRGRAVPVLMLHFPLVCTLLEARFVEHYWWRPQAHPGPD